MSRYTFGIVTNTERLVCGECGHGRGTRFFPLRISATCPNCGNEDEHMPLKQYLDGLIGRSIWHVTDVWERFTAMPVIVIGITADRKIILSCNLVDEEFQYEIPNAQDLYENKDEAMQEALRRNKHDVKSTFDRIVSRFSETLEVVQ